MVLAPERLSASNPLHLSLGRRAQAVLDTKGLLRPVLS
ncbi:MAG TPA: Imm52 family immunity protein [Archangium sp.]|nr:Imm52 family immunity protein [Archangium sp.]